MPTWTDLVDQSSLRESAGAEAFQKGQACLSDGCIGFVASTPREVTAVIRDGQVYNTIVRTVDGKLGWACSCGDVTREAPCRHVVALALALEQDPKLGH